MAAGIVAKILQANPVGIDDDNQNDETFWEFARIRPGQSNLPDVVFQIPESKIKAQLENLANSKLNFLREKELLQIALKNLYRSHQFLSLQFDLASGNIDENEFEQQLNSNSERFLIRLDRNPTEDETPIATKIVQDLDPEMTNDEVAELFSWSPVYTNRFIHGSLASR